MKKLCTLFYILILIRSMQNSAILENLRAPVLKIAYFLQSLDIQL